MTSKPKPPAGDYEVGYGKPPIHTRFPMQRRAAPDTGSKRRSKPVRAIGMRQVMADFFTAMEAPVTVTRAGKKRKLTASEAIYQQLVAKAAQGEGWALRRATDLQILFTRDYEAALDEVRELLIRLDEHEERRGRLAPEVRAIKRELERRVKDPRELLRKD